MFLIEASNKLKMLAPLTAIEFSFALLTLAGADFDRCFFSAGAKFLAGVLILWVLDISLVIFSFSSFFAWSPLIIAVKNKRPYVFVLDFIRKVVASE